MMAPADKRVLMLLQNNYFPLDQRPYAEAATLTSAGYRVTIVAPRRRGQPWHEKIGGVLVYRFPVAKAASAPGYLWEYGVSLVAMFLLSLWVLVRHGFDVVHAHNPPDILVLIAIFYKAMGKRFVFDHHDLSPELYAARFGKNGLGPVYRALVWFERLSCRVADHVIATNQSYRAIEMERSSVASEKITVVRNGPDLKRLRRVPADPQLRQKAKTILAYVGIMGPQDGVDYLLRALHHLIRDFGRRDFYCVLMGSGDAMNSLQTQANKLGLNDYVWFTGYVSEGLARYLSTADIAVAPDPSNPFNDHSTMIKIMEYMAMGMPTVAFALPESRATAGDAALYARPNDERDFAGKIATLMDDPARCEEMGRRGRQRVEQELAWPHQSSHLLEAYASLSNIRKSMVGMSTRNLMGIEGNLS